MALADRVGLSHSTARRLHNDFFLALATFALESGSTIVLTGDMRRVRSEWESMLVGRGYVPKPAMTRAVSLVVAADPDSLSGNTKKARDDGIPVVGEKWLEDCVTR